MEGLTFKLNDCGNYNGLIFSFFSNTYDCDLSYDILNMTFHLKAKLNWFIFNRRRKAGVELDLVSCINSIEIQEEDLFNIPLFKTFLMENNTKFENAKLIESFVDFESEVLKALVLKYSKELTKGIYIDDNIKIKAEEFRRPFDFFNNENSYFSQFYGLSFDECKDCLISVY